MSQTRMRWLIMALVPGLMLSVLVGHSVSPAVANPCPLGFSLVTGTTDVCERRFTATGSTTWTVPTGVTSIDVLVVGAGGRGSANNTQGGGGGGGGGIAVLTGYSTVPGGVHRLTVGAGRSTGAGDDSGFGNTSSTDLGHGVGGRGANSSTGGAGSAGSIAAGVTGRTYNGKSGQNGGSVATPPVEGQLVNDGLFVHDAERWGGGGGGGGNTSRGNSAGEANSGGGGGGDQARELGTGVATAGRAGIVIIRTQLIRNTQTVTWTPTTGISTTNSPLTPSALASTDGDGSITYSKISNTTSTCEVDGSTGVLTYTGEGNCVVRATAAATASFLEGTTDVTFTISSTNETIVATANPASLLPGSTAALTHSGSSGSGTVTWALTSGLGVCTLSGTTVTALADGLCVLTVTIAADSTYDSAQSSVTITVFSPSDGGSASEVATPAPPVEITLNPTDGTICSIVSEPGVGGSWLTLPGASDCTPPAAKAGATLLGWATTPDFPAAIAQNQVNNGWGTYERFNDVGQITAVFIPAGRATSLSGSNTLYAIWSQLPMSGAIGMVGSPGRGLTIASPRTGHARP